MALDRRNPPDRPRRVSWNSVVAGGSDFPRDKPQALKMQALPRRHRAGFARDMVFATFGYRHARALDYDGFVDRTSNLAPRRWWAAS